MDHPFAIDKDIDLAAIAAVLVGQIDAGFDREAGPPQHAAFVAGLRSTGLIAPLAIEGAMNGDLFVGYVTQQIAPLLKAGDIVILDNLPSHKRVEARRAIEAVGAPLVFLPPYRPDFNPIEQAISKLKQMLRSAKQRTVKRL